MLDRNPEVEFEFYLATKLHMTVRQIREQMTQAEFLQWNVYYGRLAQEMELAQMSGGAGK
jgi:hypothetical protein